MSVDCSKNSLRFLPFLGFFASAFLDLVFLMGPLGATGTLGFFCLGTAAKYN